MTMDPMKMMDERITRIEAKLDELIRIVAAKRDCPAPGTCLSIMPRMEKLEIGCIEASNRLNRLERWQSGIVAGIALIGFILAPTLIIFGGAIRNALNIP